MKRIVLGLFLFCCYSIAFADLTLELDKPKVQLGQPFTLTITIEGIPKINAMPDFMPLQKDFTVEGTESNISYSVINGQVRSISVWTLTLTAKRSGILPIPSLQVGQEKTAPTTIEVTEEAPVPEESPAPNSQPSPKPNAAKSQQDVLLQTEISKQNPYVNEQMIYTVKLYNSSRLLDANYQPPQVEDALFVPMGNGRRYQVNENNRIYAVEEQQFALFPQKSGHLKIKPPAFNALVYDVTPKRISVQAQPTTLNVKPIPAQFKGKKWLPAKQVTLSENYDKSTSSITEGSTLVRTVDLQAVAVPAQLLPTLDFANADQFSVYPEKPIENNQFRQQDLIGRTSVKLTYLFNKAGKATIPALTLPWFNTITGKEELSSLPGFTIDVIALNTSNSNNKPVVAVKAPQKQQQMPIMNENKGNLLAPLIKPQSHLAWWLAAGFALAWLFTVASWAWQYRGRELSGQTRSQVLKELQQACLNNQPKAARDALVKWGRLQWPEATVLNLFDLEQLVDESVLKQHINQLAQVLYHDTSLKAWEGIALWQAMVNFNPPSAKKSDKLNPLPPINRI